MILTSDSNGCSTVSAEVPRQMKHSVVELDVSTTSFQQRKRTKRVHFNERRNQSYTNEQRVAEDCHETWYSDDDYFMMRSETRDCIERLRRMDQEIDDDQDYTLSDILRAMLDMVCSITQVVDDARCLLNDETERVFSLLYSSNNNCIDLIGNELYLQSRWRSESKARRDSILDVVYDIQNEYTAGILTEDKIEEELRESCLYYSQAMVLLAQLQAQAQLSIDTI